MAKSKDWDYLDKSFEECWEYLARVRYNLWRFLAKMKRSDIVIVPKLETFSVYAIGDGVPNYGYIQNYWFTNFPRK